VELRGRVWQHRLNLGGSIVVYATSKVGIPCHLDPENLSYTVVLASTDFCSSLDNVNARRHRDRGDYQNMGDLVAYGSPPLLLSPPPHRAFFPLDQFKEAFKILESEIANLQYSF